MPGKETPFMKTTLRLLAVGALALSGCMSLRGELTLDRQARASGEMVIEITKQVAGLAGITSVEALRSQFEQSQFPHGNLKVTETDQAYRATAKVSHQPLDDPSGFSASVTGGQVAFSLSMGDQTTPATTDEFGLGDTQLGNIDLTVHFPGRIVSSSGPGLTQVDDHTIRIKAPLTANLNGSWQATSAIDPASSSRQVLLIAVAAVVVAVALGSWWLLRRRRQTPDMPDESPDASAPTQPEATWPGSGSTWPDR